MLFVVRLFQIRQEKPYYIADPEVDSLVSSIFHIKFLRPGSYPCVRPRTNTYALWIKLFVVVLKNFYISGSQSVGRDKNSKVNEPAPGHEFKWLLVTFAWEPLSNGARKKKTHKHTHSHTDTGRNSQTLCEGNWQKYKTPGQQRTYMTLFNNLHRYKITYANKNPI